MLGTQSGFSSLGESSQAKRCKCWQSEVHQSALKWKGLRMWAGYQQHPLCSLKTKQNIQSSPRVPHIIKRTTIYSASHAKDLTILLDMFFGLVLFCVCLFLPHIQSIPKSCEFHFQNISESYYFSPSPSSSFTRFLL